jgi:hypothetical protein
MTLIKSGIVTYRIEVPEKDVRAALEWEAAEKHGLTHEGKLIPGVTASVTYDGRRGDGAYFVNLRRDIAASGQAQLPKAGE